MAIFRHLVSILAGLHLVQGSPVSQTPSLVTYAIPSGAPVAYDYNVLVRTPKGNWQSLDTYAAKVEQINATTGSSISYTASMAYFDFDGMVEISVQYLNETISDVEIRPLSYNLSPKHAGNNTYTFELTSASNVVFQVNDNIFNALHIFTNPIEKDVPSANATDIVYFGPGVHSVTGGVLNATAGQTIYLAGGAVLTSPIHVLNTTNVTILGRGVIYNTPATSPSVDIEFSSGVVIDGIISLNPRSSAFLAGQSEDVTFRNIRAFSATSWGDGIDLYSSRNVIVQNVFMRTSDDCIAIYNHRVDWYGNSTNITVSDSSLWADVAHPINLATHGNPDDPETLSDLIIRNIDILDHREPQMDYQGCIAINPGDDNTVRDVLIEDIRVENFRLGQLVNMRVMYNNKYNTAPGRLISNITIRDMTYIGNHSNPSLILGYDEERIIEFVTFENLTINGLYIADDMQKPSWYLTSDTVPMYVNEHVTNLTFA